MKLVSQPRTLVPAPILCLSNLSYGEVFLHKGSYRMKLKPTNFLLNSNLIADLLNRTDCLVCDLEKGIVYFMSGNTVLDTLPDVTLLVKE